MSFRNRERHVSLLATNGCIPRWAKNITYLLFIALITLLTACSLPRIVVLDDPLSPEEHLNLGVTYEKNDELGNALKEYETASKKLPEACLYAGNVYFRKKDFEKAELSYRKAIRKKPEIADAYNNLAWLYYVKRENLEEAENLARKAMSLNTAKASVYQDTLEKIQELKCAK